MLNSKIIKKAWEIRKAAAEKLVCNVMDVMFGICIEMAKNGEEIEMEEQQDLDIVKESVLEYMKNRLPKHLIWEINFSQYKKIGDNIAVYVWLYGEVKKVTDKEEHEFVLKTKITRRTNKLIIVPSNSRFTK